MRGGAWRWQAIRAATVVAFLALAAVAIFTFTGGDDEGQRLAEARKGEATVADAIAYAGDRPLAVRGLPYAAKGGELRLCSGLEGANPRQCIGPYLRLEATDAQSLGIDEEDEGVRWSDDEVTVQGTILGTEMRVQTVLQ